MLQAVIFHSDNLELSEQFDATTGYEKSVSNLSWSYASFLSAVRARNAIRLAGGHHDGVRRVVILGRGGAGKSALSRQLSDLTGIPHVELDSLFWQAGSTPMDPSRWAVCQQELIQRDRWILDGDLGPYDTALSARLRAADTIVILDFPFLRCAWRTLRRGREQAEYWRWVWAYRRRSLPDIMRAMSSEAPHAKLYVLRNPAIVQRFVAEVRLTVAQERLSG